VGLRETMSKAAQTAFTAAGDIPVATTYYQRGSTVYDASTGTVSAGVNTYLFSMIFAAFKSNEIDNEHILATDQKGLVPQANFSTIPAVGDYLFIVESGASVRYDVQGFKKDPADALWTLQLRKP